MTAKHLTKFLPCNNYIDTSCQKADVPGFSGCSEHATLIWDQIQSRKKDKKDLHVVWLDLENYGSVPHQLIDFVLDFFYVPTGVINIIQSYFANLKICHSLCESTTSWQKLGR